MLAYFSYFLFRFDVSGAFLSEFGGQIFKTRVYIEFRNRGDYFLNIIYRTRINRMLYQFGTRSDVGKLKVSSKIGLCCMSRFACVRGRPPRRPGSVSSRQLTVPQRRISWTIPAVGLVLVERIGRVSWNGPVRRFVTEPS